MASAATRFSVRRSTCSCFTIVWSTLGLRSGLSKLLFGDVAWGLRFFIWQLQFPRCECGEHVPCLWSKDLRRMAPISTHDEVRVALPEGATSLVPGRSDCLSSALLGTCVVLVIWGIWFRLNSVLSVAIACTMSQKMSSLAKYGRRSIDRRKPLSCV
jgi:hypothetical protein